MSCPEEDRGMSGGVPPAPEALVALYAILKETDIGRFWKYRAGKYRIVCDIQDLRRTILVVRVGHRRKIYR
jgi:mRNA-degrading endonuclease RelE of RelBE toxin-antitoxin system